MFDFRLKVFYTVAKRRSFTKAANDLMISQPAVTKHIQEIESNYQTKLFVRDGMKIYLTEAGELLNNYAEEIFSVYRNLEFDMHALKAKVNGNLRVGASTTISQYVLPPLLVAFKKKVSDLHLDVISENTTVIENLLLTKKIDIGLIEGNSRNPLIKYTNFIEDEIVLVCGSNNPLTNKETITPSELKELPLLLRETGSGTLDVVIAKLKEIGINLNELNHEMCLSSTESIKMYLMHSNSVAFLSIHSVLKELRNNELSLLEVEGLDILRAFSVIGRQGQESALEDIFIRFLKSHNLKL